MRGDLAERNKDQEQQKENAQVEEGTEDRPKPVRKVSSGAMAVREPSGPVQVVSSRTVPDGRGEMSFEPFAWQDHGSALYAGDTVLFLSIVRDAARRREEV